MRSFSRRLFPVLLCIITVFLAGCSLPFGGGDAGAAEGSSASSAAPAQDVRIFPKPEMLPKILTDQTGYHTGAEKIVLFACDTPPAEYEVRRVTDDETVFTGAVVALRDGAVADDGTPMFYGAFTDFQTEGSYYIYADGIGSSYAFTIGGGIEAEALNSALSALVAMHSDVDKARRASDPTLEVDVAGGWRTDDNGGKDTAASARALRTLLMAYEINTAAFTDETGHPSQGNAVPDILDEARFEADYLCSLQGEDGGIPAGVTVAEPDGATADGSTEATVLDPTPEASILAASALAKLSFLMRDIDADYAATCLHAAEQAYAYSGTGRTIGRDTAAFSAAAELYRLTGEKKYENILSSIFTRPDFETLFLTDADCFHGSVTYIATIQPVNVQVCEQIMGFLRQSAEQIAQKANLSPYLVTTYAFGEDFPATVDSLLTDMRTLAVCDHIIYNHEYTTVIENHAHFLRGRNPLAVNLAEDKTEHTYLDAGLKGLTTDPVHCAGYLLIISML